MFSVFILSRLLVLRLPTGDSAVNVKNVGPSTTATTRSSRLPSIRSLGNSIQDSSKPNANGIASTSTNPVPEPSVDLDESKTKTDEESRESEWQWVKVNGGWVQVSVKELFEENPRLKQQLQPQQEQRTGAKQRKPNTDWSGILGSAASACSTAACALVR